MKSKIITTIIFLCLTIKAAFSADVRPRAQMREFYQLTIYHIKDKTQEDQLDRYLAHAYLPALKRAGIKNIGVFKILGVDTAVDKKIYVLIPFSAVNTLYTLKGTLERDSAFNRQGLQYLNAGHTKPPYIRQEVMLMRAFKAMPKLKKPALNSKKEDRVYELRSYESATEKLYQNKVDMFNEDEMEIFERIGSQPIFYGEVIAGSRMPNLMYMTSYDSMDSRNARWKTFGSDPKWKAISALPKYQNNMTKADIIFLTPTVYSDL